MDNADERKPTLVVFLTGGSYTFEDYYWWLCKGLSSKEFAIALHVSISLHALHHALNS